MAREAIAAAAAADFPRRGSGVASPEARLEEEEEEEAEANDEWRDSDPDPDLGGQERERRRACCCCARHVDSMLWEVVGFKDCFGW